MGVLCRWLGASYGTASRSATGSTKNRTTRHGIFCVSNGDLFERLLQARDRSTTNRDTHWKFGISGWSTPCVIAFPAASDDITTLGRIGQCQKSCVEAPVGSSMQLPTDVMLCVCKPEYTRYRCLPPIHDQHMMCGGKEQRGEVDPLHWARDDNNMRPSCGRTSPMWLLRSPGSPWSRTKRGHIWFCSSACRELHACRWT